MKSVRKKFCQNTVSANLKRTKDVTSDQNKVMHSAGVSFLTLVLADVVAQCSSDH